MKVLFSAAVLVFFQQVEQQLLALTLTRLQVRRIALLVESCMRPERSMFALGAITTSGIAQMLSRAPIRVQVISQRPLIFHSS